MLGCLTAKVLTNSQRVLERRIGPIDAVVPARRDQYQFLDFISPNPLAQPVMIVWQGPAVHVIDDHIKSNNVVISVWAEEVELLSPPKLVHGFIRVGPLRLAVSRQFFKHAQQVLAAAQS